MIKQTISTFKDIPRIKEIATVMAKFGLGSFLQKIKLTKDDSESTLAGHFTVQRRFRMAFEELGPTFIKLGQILSTRIDILPPEWISEFSMLQSNVKPVDFAEITRTVELALGCPVSTVFKEFDQTPVGSASIAQVHRAVLQNGEEVAVKVKRPGINKKIESDLRILTMAVGFIESEMPELESYQPKQMLEYFTKSIHNELDLTKEASNMLRFQKMFEENSDVNVPKVYTEYSNHEILVQEYIKGKLLKNANEHFSDEQRQIIAKHCADAILEMILVYGFFHADPHPGNIYANNDGQITLIDFGMVGTLGTKRKSEIVGLLRAMSEHNKYDMQFILSNWVKADSIHEEENLGDDVLDIMLSYEHTPMKNLNLSDVINDIIGVIRHYHLSLPPDLTMMFKSLMMLDSLVRNLAPDFRLLDHTKPTIKKIILQSYSPRQIYRRQKAQLRLYAKLLEEFPINAIYFGKRLKTGKFNFNLNVQHLEEFGNKIDRSSGRLTMGIVSGSLIIGSSIVMSTNSGPKLFGFPALGLAGYIIAFFISMWLIWTIWRSGKH